MLEIIILIVSVVVIAILVFIIVILAKRRKADNDEYNRKKLSHDELIVQSRDLVKRNYKKMLSLYELYKGKLSTPSIKAIEELLPKMQYCSPSVKEEVWQCDKKIEGKLVSFEEILNVVKDTEVDTKDVLFEINALLASRSVEV